jgi:hypothetical protein
VDLEIAIAGLRASRPDPITGAVCEVVPTSETERLPLLGHFLVKQRQKHFMPILVTRRIVLALGYQPSIMLNVCVVDETLHCDLPLAVSETARRPRLPLNPTVYGSRRKATKD